MGSEAEVADCRARWRLRSGLKQQLLKSGLGLCVECVERDFWQWPKNTFTGL